VPAAGTVKASFAISSRCKKSQCLIMFCLNPTTHTQRAVMSFDDEAMDNAYKCLESTESYCEIGVKKMGIFSSSSEREQQQMLSAHDRLHCKTIMADCILFEALLVFLKQGLTSYVKGGYLLRKAYKMYEKVFEETEQLCKLPSPISKSGMPSPLDKHVGTSVYDKETSKAASSNGHDGAFIIEDGLSSMHIGFSGLTVDSIQEAQEQCKEENGGEGGRSGWGWNGREGEVVDVVGTNCWMRFRGKQKIESGINGAALFD